MQDVRRSVKVPAPGCTRCVAGHECLETTKPRVVEEICLISYRPWVCLPHSTMARSLILGQDQLVSGYPHGLGLDHSTYAEPHRKTGAVGLTVRRKSHRVTGEKRERCNLECWLGVLRITTPLSEDKPAEKRFEGWAIRLFACAGCDLFLIPEGRGPTPEGA